MITFGICALLAAFNGIAMGQNIDRRRWGIAALQALGALYFTALAVVAYIDWTVLK